MERGLIAGKFLPPHAGHDYLIETARAQCDQLTVLICERPEYGIPASMRQGWLQTIYPDVAFQVIEDTLDDNDSPGWAANSLKTLEFRPDVVFSSEDYGPGYAQGLGCRHVSVDRERLTQPISGTAIRNNPWENWQYLHPVVRAFFAKRVCIVGSESSGTTTLAKALAKHYQTEWVPEYGRTYAIEQSKRLEREGWKTADFVTIAKEQNRQEDELAMRANRLLICDTDSFATSIWHELYMRERSYQVEALAAKRDYSLYLLTDPSIPFEDDGTRDREEFRPWMHERFQEKLRFWNKPFIIMSGDRQQRLDRAVAAIDMLFSKDILAIPGMERNSWHPDGGF